MLLSLIFILLANAAHYRRENLLFRIVTINVLYSTIVGFNSNSILSIGSWINNNYELFLIIYPSVTCCVGLALLIRFISFMCRSYPITCIVNQQELLDTYNSNPIALSWYKKLYGPNYFRNYKFRFKTRRCNILLNPNP